jgi:uncharacterized membrane protein YgcG
MMKKLLLPLLVLALIPFACQEDKLESIYNDTDVAHSNESNITSAKSWFNNKILKNRSLRGNLKNPKSPKWENAYYYDFEFGKAVVVPLDYKQNIYPKYNKGDQKKEPPKHRLGLNELNRLIIYKDTKGAYQEKIIKLVPDEDYLDKSNSRKKVVPYGGYLIVEDWDENFLEGYKYENGNSIANIVSLNKNARPAYVVCETTDYYSCASGDGGQSWDCQYTHSETVCSDDGNSGSGGGSSSGGGSYGGYASSGGISYVISGPSDYFIPNYNNTHQRQQLLDKFCTTDANWHGRKSQIITEAGNAGGNAFKYKIGQNPDIGWDKSNNVILFRSRETNRIFVHPQQKKTNDFCQVQ